MKNEKVYLQGLNYRIPDSEAVPGTCRIMENMYPSGDMNSPMWSPAAEKEEYFKVTDRTIFASYVWYRSNMPSVLVYLEGSVIGGYASLYSIPLDKLTGYDATHLWSLNNITSKTEASFAQMGDTLVVCFTQNGQPLDMVVVSTEDGVTVAKQYNSYNPPDVKIYCGVKNSSDTRTQGYVCYRTYYILDDGTLVFPSTIYTAFCPNKTNLIFKIPKMDFHPDCIVNGIAIYVSEKKETLRNALEQPIFRKVATIKDISKADSDIITVDLESNEFLTGELLEEDLLATHKTMATGVHSYNKMLLLNGVTYEFAKPSVLSGNISILDDSGSVVSNPRVPSNVVVSPNIVVGRTATTGLLSRFDIHWNSAQNASDYKIETYWYASYREPITIVRHVSGNDGSASWVIIKAVENSYTKHSISCAIVDVTESEQTNQSYIPVKKYFQFRISECVGSVWTASAYSNIIQYP